MRGVFLGILAGIAMLPAADLRGTVTIERKLSRSTITASAGLYQRGPAVELETDAAGDPLAYERSHVVVYLEGAPQTAGNIKPAQMEQRDRHFSPDLVVIPAGGAVSFPNFDPIFHNVFSLSKAKSFDLGNYPKGQTRNVTFATAGIIAVYCHLHPNMSANIVVTPSPWGVIADGAGNFTLKDVPAGNYTVVAWHKAAGTFRQTIHIGSTDAEMNFVLPYVEPAASHVAHR